MWPTFLSEQQKWITFKDGRKVDRVVFKGIRIRRSKLGQLFYHMFSLHMLPQKTFPLEDIIALLAPPFFVVMNSFNVFPQISIGPTLIVTRTTFEVFKTNVDSFYMN